MTCRRHLKTSISLLPVCKWITSNGNYMQSICDKTLNNSDKLLIIPNLLPCVAYLLLYEYTGIPINYLYINYTQYLIETQNPPQIVMQLLQNGDLTTKWHGFLHNLLLHSNITKMHGMAFFLYLSANYD